MSTSSWSALLIVLLLPVSVCACLWDHDTLKQERSRFPSTLELITGKFLRHSPEFYAWRIQDRQAKLDAGSSNPGLYDDLAVAYQMTGDTAKAIAVMEAKEKLHPGLYETYSNRGTFHILAGDFEAGLPDIDRALAINPDAHFGREKFQKWLVEYAMTRRKDGKIVFPMCALEDQRVDRNATFVAFLAKRHGVERIGPAERQAAVKGVLGMMRFANYRNPLLLEALGELLHDHDGGWDAKHLSARAYLQASYQVEGPAREAYCKLAEASLNMQTPRQGEYRSMKLAEIEPAFQAELADAEKWYAELKTREVDWIAKGLNADAEFDRLYTAEPKVLATAEPFPAWHGELLFRILIFGGVGVLVVLFWRFLRFLVKKAMSEAP